MESLIEHIVRKMVSSPQTVAQLTKAIIENSGFISFGATIAMSEQQNCTDKRAKIEKCCRQYVEAGLRFDPITAPNPSEICEKLRSDI